MHLHNVIARETPKCEVSCCHRRSKRPSPPPPSPPPFLFPCRLIFILRVRLGKVSWHDLELLLREKADATVLTELDENFATRAALERVELGLARAVGMEEVRWSSLTLLLHPYPLPPLAGA